jgi:transcriptional regulator with GAF, ATPase, and Fis domain
MDTGEAKDLYEGLLHVLETLTEPNQPKAVLEMVSKVLAKLTGYKLFTVMTIEEGTLEAERVFTSDEVVYPLQQLGTIPRTEWTEHVIFRRQAWVGKTLDDVCAAYPDYVDIIKRLGCSSSINSPVVFNGKVIAVLNMLNKEQCFTEEDVKTIQPFAALLGPVLNNKFL